MTLTVGTLLDTALRVREIGRADVREVDVAELVAHSQLLAEFALIVIRDGGGIDGEETKTGKANNA